MKFAEKVVRYRSEIAVMLAEGISDADMVERVSGLIYRERITKECEQCGVAFGTNLFPSVAKRTRFCSRSCKAISHTVVFRERWAELIAQRERGDTYQSIGDHYDISRERVRQILHQTGRSDLCFRQQGPRVARIRRICANPACGQEFEALPSANRVVCSRKCQGALRANELWKNARPRVERIIKLRRNGMTWKEAGIAVGFSSTQPATEAIQLIKRWHSYRPDLDVTGMMDGRTRKT